MVYNALGIGVTDRCSAECRMCCFSCSNKGDTVLDKEVIKDVMRQAAVKKNMNQIGFSGGEVFLYYDLLLELVKEAKKYGYWSTCSTNAFWCSDYAKTKEILAELKKAGLGGVRLSVDACHQEQVAVENVKNLLNATKENNIRCFVSTGITKSTKENTMNLLSKLEGELFYKELLLFPFLPIGRAKEQFDSEDFYRLTRKDQLRCEYNRIFPLMPNGDVFVCDSSAMINTGLKIGNVYNDTLDEILANIRNCKRQFIVMTKGLQWFVKTIEEHKLAELDEYYVNACHFCHDVFGNKELYNKLLPYME